MLESNTSNRVLSMIYDYWVIQQIGRLTDDRVMSAKDQYGVFGTFH